jgi:hypothetical protein
MIKKLQKSQRTKKLLEKLENSLIYLNSLTLTHCSRQSVSPHQGRHRKEGSLVAVRLVSLSKIKKCYLLT